MTTTKQLTNVATIATILALGLQLPAPAAAADQCTAVEFGASAGLKEIMGVAFSPNASQIALSDRGNKRALILDAATGDTIKEISLFTVTNGNHGSFGGIDWPAPDVIDQSYYGGGHGGSSRASVKRHTLSTGATITAGSGESTCKDGTFALAGFKLAVGISTNPNDTTITAVADMHCNSVRLVDWAAQTVTSIGPMDPQYNRDTDGVKDGPGSVAQFYRPRGVDWSPDGTMIAVADAYNEAVRLVTYPGLVVSTLAGSGFQAGAGHVDAVGRDARFKGPVSVSFSPDSKYVVVSDTTNDQIRKIEVATGVVTTLTGFTTAGGVYGADGVLDGPEGLDWHPTDPTKVFVANHYRDNILILTCAELVPPPPPTGSPTPGPTSNPTPGPTTNPSPGPTASPSPEPTPGPTSQIDALEDKMDSVLAALLDMKDLLNQRDQAPVCYGRRSQTQP